MINLFPVFNLPKKYQYLRLIVCVLMNYQKIAIKFAKFQKALMAFYRITQRDELTWLTVSTIFLDFVLRVVGGER